MSDQTQTNTGFSLASQDRIIQLTFLQMRLDTGKIIKDTEEFLSNTKTYVIQAPDGSFTEKRLQAGDPLANPKGIIGIINIVNMVINPQSVQGNFDERHYFSYIERARKEICNEIVLNCYDWGISDDKLNYIIDNIMRIIEPFISRLINNEERKSYMQSVQTKEVYNTGNKNNAAQQFANGVGI